MGGIVRFLHVDRILELETKRRILAIKLTSRMDEYLTCHYGQVPLVPSTMVIEALLQTVGWLHVVNWDFRVKGAVMLIEGVRIYRQVRPGETILLEAEALHSHPEGITARAEARVGSEVVLVAERVILSHDETSDPTFIENKRKEFECISDKGRWIDEL
jgi:3-hydroxyacyl-[acyl-carrier-protein] dehydratase